MAIWTVPAVAVAIAAGFGKVSKGQTKYCTSVESDAVEIVLISMLPPVLVYNLWVYTTVQRHIWVTRRMSESLLEPSEVKPQCVLGIRHIVRSSSR